VYGEKVLGGDGKFTQRSGRRLRLWGRERSGRRLRLWGRITLNDVKSF